MERVKIIDYGYDGEGVGRLQNGKICFVPYALLDEVVDIDVIDENKHIAWGRIINTINPSKERKAPLCPYFQDCGGCCFHNIDYEKELEIKKYMILNQLRKLNYNSDVEIKASENRFYYRNKIRLFVGNGKIGLKRLSSNDIIDIDKCMICGETINFALLSLRKFIAECKLFDMVESVVLREEKGLCLINFFVNRKKNIDYFKLLNMLGNNFGIYETCNKQTVYQAGLKALDVCEMGLKCQFSPTSFHQVNMYMNDKLYSYVIDNIQGENIVNCYSGAGVLSCVMAQKANSVQAIEIGKSEHFDAEKLKSINNIQNLKNYLGDCVKILPNLENNYDTIVIDPPRKGIANEVCSTIQHSSAKKIIYISCNCATLVRDVAKLTNFSIEKVALFDMFSLTGEYETVMILTRKD